MVATFLIVPEWQGSGSSRAMQLIDGADAIAGDLPASVTRRLEITLGAGESLGSGVARVSVLRSIRDSVTRALNDALEPTAEGAVRPDLVVTIGGDCGVELAPIAEAKRLHPELAVVWLDAHADLVAPESSGSGTAPSVSGPFSSMVLRTLLGDGTELLVPDFAQTLSPSRVILAGVRSLDDDEQTYIDENHITEVSIDDLQQSEELERGDALVEAISATGATEVYLHVDLDVLDPAEITGLSYPEPFGLTVAALVENIVAVRRRFTVVGAAITQFAPANPDAASDDLSAVLRIISALTRAL
ncbi:arginase family protein [Subtercola endophyticus]|uniref:arginase family protein n=1 Tax=Subtercola endophyticus TaxID=2895559 RepID=UPI001E44AA60|nr:arginase family protein [Subtercola endophyticus]UFS60026.1 arginase family protein [Subtercola endophyticus]